MAEEWVWRTSLAAGYPCGLCVAWSRALLNWLNSESGSRWIERRIMIKLDRWNNTLIRGDLVRQGAPTQSLEAPATHQSSRDLRESENLHAIGGLRNPRHAVRKSPQPREVGSRIRQVLDSMSWRFSALSFKKRTSLQDWRTDGFQSFVRNLQTHSRLLRFSPASKRPCGPQCSAMLPILTQKS